MSRSLALVVLTYLYTPYETPTPPYPDPWYVSHEFTTPIKAGTYRRPLVYSLSGHPDGYERRLETLEPMSSGVQEVPKNSTTP